MKLNHGLCFLVLALALSLAGCAGDSSIVSMSGAPANNPSQSPSNPGGPPSAPSKTVFPFIYTGTPKTSVPTHDFEGFRVDAATGTLSPVPGSPFLTGSTGFNSEPFADPQHQYIFVQNTTIAPRGELSGTTDLSIFKIDQSTGSLSAVAGSPFADLDMGFPFIDSSGSRIYTFTGETYSIGDFDRNNGNIVFGPSNSFGSSSEPLFDVHALTHLTAPSPYMFAIANSDPFHQALWTFEADKSSGLLTPVQHMDIPIDRPAPDLKIDPAGKFLFYKTFTTFPAFSIFSFFINADGSLTQTGAIQFSDPEVGLNLQGQAIIDKSGRFLYFDTAKTVNGNLSGKVFGFSINQSDGSLIPIPGSPFDQTGASCKLSPLLWNVNLLDDSGNFFYVGPCGARIDQTTGALTFFSVTNWRVAHSIRFGLEWGSDRS